MRGNARILTVLLCLTLILGLCGCGCSCRHEWVDATCTEPKTCAKCGETQGEALGHTPGEWQQDEPDDVTSVIWLRQYCTVCGAEVDVDMKALSSYCQDGTLLLSPEEFAERLDNLFGTLTNHYGADCDFSAKIMSAEEDSMGCVVANAKGELLCVALFTTKTGSSITDPDSRKIAKIVAGFTTQDSQEIVSVLFAMTLAVDPALEVSSAKEVAGKFLDDPYSYHGLRYAFDAYSGEYYFSISVE